jgi:acyl-CoA thioester hydrolase
MFIHIHELRVRYSESDRMGTFYNSRLLEWMEVGRTELLRAAGYPYIEWENKGLMAPIVESHLKFKGRAGYDDLLRIETRFSRESRARLRFDTRVCLADSDVTVAEGWTIHALTNPEGKPMRIPDWVDDLINGDEENE